MAMLSLKVLGKPTLSFLPVSGARGVAEVMVAVTVPLYISASMVPSEFSCFSVSAPV